MATSKSWAQDVITCDFCDKATQQFCNSCQVSLCETCVRKHRHELKAVSHDIVPFLERKIQLAFPLCRLHPGQRCEVHCKKCKTSICVKCLISGVHKEHGVEDLAERHECRRRQIEAEIVEFKAEIIPQYQREDANIKKSLSKAKIEFSDFEKENKTLRRLWHEEVDKIFNKVDSISQSTKNRNMKALQSNHVKIRKLIHEMNERVEENERTLKTNKLSKVDSYKSIVKKYRELPEEVTWKIPNLTFKMEPGKELGIEIGDFKATLTHRIQANLLRTVSRLTLRLGDPIPGVKFQIVATISTNYQPLIGMVCVGEEEVWVHGNDNTITRIDIHGSMKNKITTSCKYGPSGISITQQMELLYSDNDCFGRTVKVVKDGNSMTLITTPHGWKARGLCCTRSGDILIHTRETFHSLMNKIVCYRVEKNGQIIVDEERVKRCFLEGFSTLCMSENCNGDVCVSDTNAKTVVVVDKKGKTRFQYDGTPAKRKKSFYPNGIVTDSFGNIIVTDANNDCLHILNENGHFLKCLDDFELAKPFALSIDRDGKLWVGSHSTGIIKVIDNW
ncbi:uncharacterized protein LOC111114428 [Crassostrea virginica]